MNRQLTAAIEAGDIVKTSIALNNGAHPDIHALWLAADRITGDNVAAEQVFDLVLGKTGAGILNGQDEAPLHILLDERAAAAPGTFPPGRAIVIKKLIAATKDFTLRNKRGETAVHMAVSCGFADAVTAMLDAGAPVELTDKDKHSLLMCAVLNGQPDMVDLLLARGASLKHQKDHDGEDLLDLAFCKLTLHPTIPGLAKEIETALARVIRAGYDIVTRARGKPSRAYAAVVLDSLSILQALIEVGAPVDEQDSNNETPLTTAVLLGNVACADLLIAAGANMLARDGKKSVVEIAKDSVKGDLSGHFVAAQKKQVAIKMKAAQVIGQPVRLRARAVKRPQAPS